MTSTEPEYRWTCVTKQAEFAARDGAGALVFDGRIWVMEGWNKGNRSDVWHSPDGITWHELPNTPWPPRHAASAFVHDNSLWVVAGNNMTPDVWRLERA